MNKNKFIVLACVALIAIPVFVAAQSAPSTGSSDSSSSGAPSTGGSTSSVAPSSGGSSSSAGSGSAPSTGGSTSSAGPSTGGSSSSSGSSSGAPSTGGSTSSAGPTSSSGGSSTGGSTSSGSSPTYSSSSSGSYYSYSSGGGSIYGIQMTAAAVSAVPVANGSCPLITGFMRLGAANDPSQVAKLQSFLKNDEGAAINVNGIYDQNTEAAVEAFQRKYLSEVMGPWGATRASGIVYITTAKKINEITCSSPLTLTPAELAVINAYKAAQASGTSTSTAMIGMNEGVTATPSPTMTATSTMVGPTIGDNGQVVVTPNTAAAANASVLQRFWSFVVGLFHR